MRSRTRTTGHREHMGTHPWVRLPAPPDAPPTAPFVGERTTLPEARVPAAVH
jgi:hypothetical protein